MNFIKMFEKIGYRLYSIEPIIQFKKDNKKICFGSDNVVRKFYEFTNEEYNPSNLDEMFPTFSCSNEDFSKDERDAIKKAKKELNILGEDL